MNTNSISPDTSLLDEIRSDVTMDGTPENHVLGIDGETIADTTGHELLTVGDPTMVTGTLRSGDASSFLTISSGEDIGSIGSIFGEASTDAWGDNSFTHTGDDHGFHADAGMHAFMTDSPVDANIWDNANRGSGGSVTAPLASGELNIPGTEAASPTSTHNFSLNTLSGTDYINSLLSKFRWAPNNGATTVVLTYSFTSNNSVYASGYPDADGDGLSAPNDGRQLLNAGEKQAVRDALAKWSDVANITFTEVTDSATVAGDLRFAYSKDPAVAEGDTEGTAYAYYPSISTGNQPWAGDIWLYDSTTIHNPAPGTYAFTNILMHEIGHALGLKHPHQAADPENLGPVADSAVDSTLYSIMSYRDYAGDALDGVRLNNEPRTPMMNDIAAIQYLYGANTSHHTGNDVYLQNAGDQVFPQTIWDGGGIDTIDWGLQSTAVEINLTPGSFSRIGPGFDPEPAGLDDPLATFETRTVAIAYNTLIENANGGSGNDTITGNNLANTLNGFDGADTIDGGAGNDSINGNLGNDCLVGGFGNDTIFGGSLDNDSLYGNNGNDSLNGGSGDDFIDGGSDSDTLLGGDGNDTILGGTNDNDFLFGGAGADSMDGGSGDDSLDGDLGNDFLVGGLGNDTIFGGALDNDSLYGNNGNDSLNGGSGDDFLDGGNDSDTLSGGEGNDTIFGGTNDNDFLFGGAGADSMDGGSGDDSLDGGAGADILLGGGGNDRYEVDHVGDVVTENGPGTDFDTVVSLVTFAMGANLETLTLAGAGVINGTGNGLRNTITGNAAANILDGGNEADTLVGGAGNDTYVVDNVGDVITEGGPGTDIDTVMSSITLTLGATLEKLTLTGTGAINGTGNGLANTIIGNVAGNNLTGLSGSDTLDGLAGGDFINGNDGNDSIRGGEGNDTIFGGSLDNDSLFGDAGNDSIDGGSGNDFIDGGIDADMLIGGDGNDTIFGGALDNDTLKGGAGLDSLDGGSGNDSLDGGADSDTLTGGLGNDTITQGAGAGSLHSVDGGGGTDLLTDGDYSAETAGLFIGSNITTFFLGGILKNIETFSNLRTGSGNDTITFAGTFNDVVNAGAGNDSIFGSAGDDTVNPGLGNDTMDGGTGTDMLVADYSGDGNPIFYQSYNASGSGVFRTNSGNQITYSNTDRFNLTGTGLGDDLRGGALSDALNGGSGNDTITGGGGSPTDGIDGGTGIDVLTDGDYSAITVGLNMGSNITTNFLSGGFVTRIESFGNLRTGSGNDTITFVGTLNDSVNAGAGNDAIIAGGGNDTVNPGLGADNVNGGTGTDILVADYTADPNPIGYATYDPVAGDGIFGTGTGNSVTYSGIERFNLTGTVSNDDLRGGPLADTLIGGLGDDRITQGGGLASADSIDGKAGTDVLVDGDYSAETTGLNIGSNITTAFSGGVLKNIESFSDLKTGSGNDTITFAGTFNDSVNAGAGNDTITTGLGADNVNGGAGTDMLVADYTADPNPISYSAYDPVTGDGSFGTGSGYSVTYSGIERFSLTGTVSNDDLRGGSLADTLIGGDGADRITSLGGSDSIDGGAGTDTLVDANFSAESVGLNIAAGVTVNLVNGAVIKNVEAFEVLQTGSGNDTITFAGTFNDSASAGGGNDTITTGLGADNVNGEAGTDMLVADYTADPNPISYSAYDPVTGDGSFGTGSGYSVTYSGIERFSLTGTVSNDDLRGGSLADTLIGGDGADRITSLGGSDSIDGGAGTDTLVDANFSAETVGLNIAAGVTVNLANGAVIKSVEAFEVLQTGSGNDTITFAGTFNDSASAGGGNDTITTGLGADNVNGEAGTDMLVADYTADPNPISYSAYDPVTGDGSFGTGSGNFVTYSGIERFNLTGTVSNDDLRGGPLADTLIGGGGADRITSLGGSDSIDGGAGTDTLVDADFSAETVGLNIAAGVTVNLANGAVIKNVEAFEVLQTGSGNDTITFAGTFNDSASAGGGNDTITTGLGADNVNGEAGTDMLVANYTADPNPISYSAYDPVSGDGSFGTGSGNSVTYSGIERFNLTGTVSNDDLRGGPLADTLIGGDGADALTGGAGADVYGVNSVSDVIVENPGGGTDLVQSSIGLSFEANPASFGNVENLTLTGAAAINGTGNNLANTIIGNGSANVLAGGGGKDTLTGGAGLDRLTGFSGIAANGATEIDMLTGGTQADRFVLGSATLAFYDDKLAAQAGRGGYALITDFTTGEDKFQLNGTATDYYLGASGVAGVAGIGLFFEQGATDELIAIVRSANATTLTAANTIQTAVFV